MPSLKRFHSNRREGSIGDVENAPNKRPRVNTAPNGSIQSPDRDDEFYEDGPSTQFARHSNFRDEHERERDDFSEMDSDADEQNVDEMTQQMADEREQRGVMENQEAEAGVLESVVCTNFMCHPKLTVTFGPLINFIIGHNGSGKSAVLTAITLCLGGKATSTNRGQSLKSFVKEGQENATLAVKIKNRGETAYKTDLYGDSIIVERHFNIWGLSGFKIKSADGKIVTTKRSELDEITDYYALQLDNPVNVLTQDMARQFLQNSSASDKYKFLVRGVLLEQLDRDYLFVADSLNGTDVQLEHVQEDCRVLREKRVAAKKKLELSNKQNNMRGLQRKYQRQMAWAQVEEQERDLERYTKAYDRAQESVLAREQSAATISDELDRAEEQVQEKERQVEDLKRQLEPFRNDEECSRSKLADHKKDLEKTHVEQRAIHTDRTTCQKLVNTNKATIEAEKKRIDEISGGAEVNKRQEIEDAERKVTDLEDELMRMEAKYPSLENDKKQAEHDLNRAEDQVVARQKEVEQAEERLKQIRQDRGSRNSGYHPKVQDLLNAIQRDSRYKEKPVGPLGHHVRLLKPEWSSILEKTFGAALESFVVTNKSDHTILADTMRRIGCQKPIFVGRAAPLNTLHNEPDSQYDTIMRVLEIDNHLVRNQLVINQIIENIVLIKDPEQANATLYQQGGPPRGIKACLYMNPKKPGWGGRYSYGRGGSQKDDFIEPWEGATRLKTDNEAQANIQSELVSAMKRELGDAQRHKDACTNRSKTASQAIARHKKEEKNLREQGLARAREDVLERKAELDELTPGDGKLDALSHDLQQKQEELDHLESQLMACSEYLDERRQAQIPLEEDVKQKMKLVKDQEVELDKEGRRIDELKSERQSILRRKNQAMGEIRDAKEHVEHCEGLRDRQQQSVYEFIEGASSISERVPIDAGETAENLDKRLVKLDEDLKRAEREVGGDNEQIHREASEAQHDHMEAEKRFELLRNLQDALVQALQERRARWKSFRSAICTRARCQFIYLLSERGYRGRMIIDHVNKRLELHVEPDLTKKGQERGKLGRQTKTLSGGEKSFTTICMLLALWDAMGSPIRCLDEFDVFMDSVNRDISVKLLIESARRSVGRQFILITPQAMSSIDRGLDVKIIKLNDPERGQTTLNIPGA